MDFRLFVSSSSSVVKMTFSSDHFYEKNEKMNEWWPYSTYNAFWKPTKQINKQTMVWNISKVYHKKIIIIMMMIHSLSLLKKKFIYKTVDKHTHTENIIIMKNNQLISLRVVNEWGRKKKLIFISIRNQVRYFFPSFSSHSMMMMIIVINIQPAKTILINNQSI